MTSHQSWGHYPKANHQTIVPIATRFESFGEGLPRGLGRSYGDSCLNDGGTLLETSGLDHFIRLENGILTCEGGVSFAEIIRLAIPQGWFLPVTPGTKFVTVGGAIANDVHGKNHHVAGNFGHHVLKFELLRSTGERLICSREQNREFFFATIGGLGLTGLITWAQIRLKKIASSYIEQETIRFESLDEFFKLSAETKVDYTVSWVDCLNSSEVRGLFMRGKHADQELTVASEGKLKVPFYFPQWTLNTLSMKAFNFLYYHKNFSRISQTKSSYDPFFYPLDAISDWNKIYGRNGFLQYQFLVPFKHDRGDAIKSIFKILRDTQKGSFLAILKTFGSIESEGMLSFPREGVTLTLDFAVGDPKLFNVLNACDEIVADANGSVYPAKDARMSAAHFKKFYPRLEEFKTYVDPKISSSFWRRVQ